MAELKHTTASNQQISDMQLLLETTGVGMWSYDSATNAFTLDQTCREMFDLGEGQELSMEWMQKVIHPDDIGPYWAAVQESIKIGIFETSYRVLCRDGSTKFIIGRGRAYKPTPETPIMTKGVCIDVSDRRQLEQQLHAVESRTQHIADNVPGLFSYLDTEYRVQFLNAKYRELVANDSDEYIGKHISEIIGTEQFEQRKARYDEAFAGDSISHEAQRVAPDGSITYYTVNHQPHRDKDGNICGVLSLAIDITERREFQVALEAKSAELARSNHDLEQFAYVASHDLKAPLRAIEVLVQWLSEDLKDNTEGEVQENLALLAQRTKRLNKLLDDLLAYSRAGRLMGECREVDTKVLVNDIALLLSPPPKMKIVADDSLPTMIAHEAPLEQVLRNLINNAIKHHPYEWGKVHVSAEDQGNQYLFTVTDDGAGIPDEYAEKVFQMFQTLQPRDDREGSGMGLAIVKRIIDWQGGKIWFHSGADGKGTVFKFTWEKLEELPADRTVSITRSEVDEWSKNDARQHIAS